MEQTSREALGVELHHTISCSFLFDFLSWTHRHSSWIVIILPSLTIYLLSIPHFTPLLAFLFFRAKVTPHQQSESRDVGLQLAHTHDTPSGTCYVDGNPSSRLILDVFHCISSFDIQGHDQGKDPLYPHRMQLCSTKSFTITSTSSAPC